VLGAIWAAVGVAAIVMVAAVLGRRRDDPLTGETLQVVTKGGLWVVHLLPGDDRHAVARA
jgi:hypothetical protein